jgi:hypothetical protein
MPWKQWSMEEMLHAFLISALDGGEWSVSRSSCFTPEEELRAPSAYWVEAEWIQEPVWSSEKSLPETKPQLFSHVVSHLTDWICWCRHKNQNKKYEQKWIILTSIGPVHNCYCKGTEPGSLQVPHSNLNSGTGYPVWVCSVASRCVMLTLVNSCQSLSHTHSSQFSS